VNKLECCCSIVKPLVRFIAAQSFDGAEIKRITIYDDVGQRIVLLHTGPFVQGVVAAGYIDNKARPIRPSDWSTKAHRVCSRNRAATTPSTSACTAVNQSNSRCAWRSPYKAQMLYSPILHSLHLRKAVTMELVESSTALTFVTSRLQSCGILSVCGFGAGIMAFYVGECIGLRC
jgi:hypothetical protein